MIVGTDLKRIEKITGRLTTGRVAMSGLASGAWFGLFVGLVFVVLTDEGVLAALLPPLVIGALFGLIFALTGYAATRGKRASSSARACWMR